jgi:hypothetical protein
MGRKIAVLIIIIIFLIIFAGVGIYFYKDAYYKNDAVKKSDYTICSKIKNELKIAQCIGEIASNIKDASICTNSPKAYTMVCFDMLAERNGDISVCQKVTPETEEYNCYFAFADIIRSTSTCDALAGEKKDYCLKSIAVVKGDVSICDSLPASSIYKKSCPLDVEYHKA